MYSKRKSTVFPSSCFRPLSLRASNVAFENRSFLQAVVLSLRVPSKHLPQRLIFGCPSFAHKGWDIPYFVQNFLLALLHIWNRQPHILPLHRPYGYSPSSVYPIECLDEMVFENDMPPISVY